MRLYKDRALEQINMPLGGIGTGSVGISGDGRLADWEIFNHPSKGSLNGYTHLAVRADDGERILDTRVLNGDMTRGLSGQYAAASGHSGFGYGPAIATMAGFPHFRDVTFKGAFPTSQLAFRDEHFPGEVTLDAWSPMIPLDSENSSLPAACFIAAAENSTSAPLYYTFAFTVTNPAAKGSVNSAVPNGIRLAQTVLPENDPAYGELCVVCVPDGCEDIRTQLDWYRGSWFDSLGIYWRNLTQELTLPERVYDTPGQRDTATLTVRVLAKAGQSVRARFILTWYYPNRINDWSPREGDMPWRNWYATRFPSAEDVAAYVSRKWDMLHDGTYTFRDALHNANLPPEVIDAAASNLAVLKSPVVLRLEDGTFYGWEGVSERAGSCEGTCTHVWTYAYALCYLFPDLERSIRDADYKYNLEESGYMTFRLPLPLGRRNPRFHACVDGQMGGVLKVLREWRLSGDTQWLKQIYPSVKKALSFAWSEENPDAWDRDRDGVLEGRQHHTLDMELFGPSSWLEGFYLAALKAGEVMAREVGDTLFENTCALLYENGTRHMEAELFNGSWYIQKVDLHDRATLEKYGCTERYWNDEAGKMKYQIADGSEIDQMLAQYHAGLIGLGDIFDPAHRKTALASMFRHNFKPSLREFYNPCRIFALNDEGGTVICDYPDGTYKPVVPIPYAEECMTGFEYAYAALLIQNGMVDEGLTVVRAIRDRYDGEKRNPYNEIECGSNYARSMASFSLIPSLMGYVANLPEGTLTFDPKLPELSGYFGTAQAWGIANIDEQSLTLNLKAGTLALRAIGCPWLHDITHVILDGKDIPFTRTPDGVAFAQTVIRASVRID